MHEFIVKPKNDVKAKHCFLYKQYFKKQETRWSVRSKEKVYKTSDLKLRQL